jgi:hypothetical protein
MRSFVVETYLPRGRRADVAAAEARAREAARLVGRVQFVRATFLPADELCLFVFEADSARSVGDVAERAGIRAERILEAVEASREKGGMA